jgi:hypothetical protein
MCCISLSNRNCGIVIKGLGFISWQNLPMTGRKYEDAKCFDCPQGRKKADHETMVAPRISAIRRAGV